jgi:hypothetical protein
MIIFYPFPQTGIRLLFDYFVAISEIILLSILPAKALFRKLKRKFEKVKQK